MSAEQRKRERKRRKREDAKRDRKAERAILQAERSMSGAADMIKDLATSVQIDVEPVVDSMADQVHRRAGGVGQYFKRWFRVL